MRLRTLLLLALCCVAALPAWAETVVQRENVSYEYARVLRVTPVFQTLTATATEQQCEGPDGSRFLRVVGAVRSALKRDGARNCRTVQVERQFRRPVAYDVDYTYRGAKYRSRLAEDPGHVLRIRVSVLPVP